jgi:hypothetical protein
MLSAAVVDDEGPPPQQLLTQAALLIASHQALIEDASALLYERLCLEPQSSGAVKLKTLVVLKKLVRRLSDLRRPCAIVLLPWVGVGGYRYTNDWCEARCQKLSLGPSRAATACVLMTRRGGRGLRRLPSPTLRCGALWLRTPH